VKKGKNHIRVVGNRKPVFTAKQLAKRKGRGKSGGTVKRNIGEKRQC